MSKKETETKKLLSVVSLIKEAEELLLKSKSYINVAHDNERLERENTYFRQRFGELEMMLSAAVPSEHMMQNLSAFVKKTRREIDSMFGDA